MFNYGDEKLIETDNLTYIRFNVLAVARYILFCVLVGLDDVSTFVTVQEDLDGVIPTNSISFQLHRKKFLLNRKFDHLIYHLYVELLLLF